jgi:hypothetical protein
MVIGKINIENKQMNLTTIFENQGMSCQHNRGKNENGEWFHSSHFGRTRGRQRVKACEKVIVFTQSAIYSSQEADVVYHFAQR